MSSAVGHPRRTCRADRAPNAAHAASIAFAAVALAACTTSTNHHETAAQLGTLRAQGYRVAVMPFAVSAPEDGFLTRQLAPVGSVVALASEGEALPERMQIGMDVRGDFVKWLARGSFEVLDPWRSDTQLLHAGFDFAQMQDPANATTFARVLAVDGIVFGDVTSWNRSYYVVQATAEAALRVELRHGGDGSVLFRGDRLERLGSGLTGGPTGYVSAATEPIAGLRDATLHELSRTVTRGLAMDLDLDVADDGAASPALVPRLSVVTVVVPHEGALRAGERIEVLAIGSPGCDVRFDLGRLRVGVPMQQETASGGLRADQVTYRGTYLVQNGERAQDLPVWCSIRSVAGRGHAARYRYDQAVSLDGRLDGR